MPSVIDLANLKGDKGDPGYNATGAAEDDAAIAAFVNQSAGPTATGAAVAARIAAGIAAGRSRLAARAGYDSTRSAGFCQAAYARATQFSETWANLSQWAVTSGSVQVSGGRLYGVTGGGGTNHGFRVASGQTARIVFRVSHVDSGGTAGQGVLVGYNWDAVGAAPAAGGAKARGVYVRVGGSNNGIVNMLDSGTQTPTILTGIGAAFFTIVMTIDENYVSFGVVSSTGGAPRAVGRFLRDDINKPINNLTIMINDGRGLAGDSVVAITEATIGTQAFATGTTLTALQDGPGIHWGSDNGDNFLIMTPVGYDSRNPYPAVLMFHGNGADETLWLSNANGKAVAETFLSNGYIVVAAANTGATSSWGADAGLDAYTHAYQYVRDHYYVSALVVYANSMGGIVSLNVLARDVIPGIAAWSASSPTYDLVENHDNVMFTSTIDTAYGGNFSTLAAAHDPAEFDPLEFRGIPMLLMVATDDTSVTPAANGLALYSAVTQTNPVTKIEVTGGHSTSEISNQAQVFVDNCNHALGLRNNWPA